MLTLKVVTFGIKVTKSDHFLRFWEKEKPCKCCLSTTYRVLLYSEPGSNRYGHYCPQDFKSGVSTYSTIRATGLRKDVANVLLLFNSAKYFARYFAIMPLQWGLSTLLG